MPLVLTSSGRDGPISFVCISSDLRLNLDCCHNSKDSKPLKYRGYSFLAHKLSDLEQSKSVSQINRAFGTETLVGISVVFHDGSTKLIDLYGDERTPSLSNYIEIAIAGNGHLAAITRDGTSLVVYPSFHCFGPDGVLRFEPLLKLTIPSSPGEMKSFSSLSAGDAHFSFIVSYTWPSSKLEMEAYYKNIWCVRTDSRSMDDSAWVSLEEELETLEERLPVQIDVSDKEMPVLCPLTEEPVEFVQCVSSGWMTAAICDQGKAWVFPFGRAMSTIPGLPVGEITGFNNVRDISIGSSHIALRRDTKGWGEVWTFGLNDHGQRGFRPDREDDAPSWRNVEFEGNQKITQLRCGKWNTFFVVEKPNII